MASVAPFYGKPRRRAARGGLCARPCLGSARLQRARLAVWPCFLAPSGIERVDFDLFLDDLDWDDRRDEAAGRRPPPRRRLKELEAARRAALNRAAAREPIARAAESVRPIESEMLERLRE